MEPSALLVEQPTAESWKRNKHMHTQNGSAGEMGGGGGGENVQRDLVARRAKVMLNALRRKVLITSDIGDESNQIVCKQKAPRLQRKR